MASDRIYVFKKSLILYLTLILNVGNSSSVPEDNFELNNANKTIDSTASSSEEQFQRYLLQTRNADLNFTELTVKYGYKSEEYTVQTKDGYLLAMFRIVEAPGCKGPKKQPPVILQHGLLLSSVSFIEAGPGNALGYLLADACYDVWFPNQRGTNYGRRHLYLNPDTDREFWKFSVDEIGYYDIPAMIDTVLHHTGAEKVNYVGHSQGCGTFYILCSEKPKYCKDKVNLKISLAPATRHLNSRAPGFRYPNEFFNKFQAVIEGVGIHEAFPIGGIVQRFLDKLCRFEIAYPVCVKFLAVIDALNPGSIPYRTVKDMFGHIPSGTSVQNLARYGQAVNSETFKKFDYGALKNLMVYGSISPPVYNLKATTTPTVIFYGNNDGVVDKRDISWLIPRLGNVKEVIEVSDPLWNHFDFLYSQYIPKNIFYKINYYLQMFSYERRWF